MNNAPQTLADALNRAKIYQSVKKKDESSVNALYTKIRDDSPSCVSAEINNSRQEALLSKLEILEKNVKKLSEFTQQTIAENVTHSSSYLMGNEKSFIPFNDNDIFSSYLQNKIGDEIPEINKNYDNYS